MILSLSIFVGFLIFLCFFISLKNKNGFTASRYRSYGPPSYPFIGCLISFYKNRLRLLTWYTDLLTNSPSQTIVVHRLGARRTIVTANPANVEYMLKTNFNNYPKGKTFTDVLGDLLGYGIFNVDGELWKTQRKLASHEFSTNSLREFLVNTLQEVVKNRLLPVLETAANQETVLDMQDVLKRFSFDNICKMTLGSDPGSLDMTRSQHPFGQAFDRAAQISAMRGTTPIVLVWKIKKFLNIGSEKKLKELVGVVRDLVAEMIYHKKKELNEFNSEIDGHDSHDLLTRLIMADHDDEVIRDMVISFILAGRDTTSSVMTWMLWLLSQYRTVEKELLNEIDSVLSINDQTLLDFDELKEMDYMKACLCETMRLYPPVPWDSKYAVQDDKLPDGTPVTGGDRVTYFPYGMGRMGQLWGEDKLEFKPDRWYDEPGVLMNVSPFKFPVFQAGPRICLGKEMAFVQMKYVMAAVLKRFEIKPVGSDQPGFLARLTAHMDGGLKVTVRKRSG